MPDNIGIQKIQQMINLQDKLNTITCGADWKKGTCSKTGKSINWILAEDMELSEAIDSTEWKWWKSGKTDMDNFRVELVDVFHFMLSKYITTPAVAWYSLMKTSAGLTIKPEDLLRYTMMLKIYNLTKEQEQEVIVFFSLCTSIGMDFNDLYRGYIAKNTLNAFRQSHGYKDGRYKKMWRYDNETVEDNVVVMDLVKAYDVIDETGLLNDLEFFYKRA